MSWNPGTPWNRVGEWILDRQGHERAVCIGPETAEHAVAAVNDADAAHATLDAAGAPRELDGRALTLAERIAAALPPLPEPAEAWRPPTIEQGPWRRRIQLPRLHSDDAHYRHRVVVDAWPDEPVGIAIDGHVWSVLTIRDLVAALRLALGPAGIPPTEKKP